MVTIAEMLHVGLEPPRQRVVAADDAVLRDGGEKDDVHARDPGLHRDRGFDVRMRIVAFEREILVAQREQVLGVGIYGQLRQRPRLA